MAYLDGLRPEGSAAVELALLASYSADLPSIGAALLALAGRDDENGEGSCTALADAVEALRGKVRVVVQRGRIARMRNLPKIAGILDQFVREVGFDERLQSWHPKAALIRLREADDVEWRLWIGSRNLTECSNRDLGLLLSTRGPGRGRAIPGLEAVARALAGRAGLDGVKAERLAGHVAQLSWHAPPGVRVERVLITNGDSRNVPPTIPRNLDEVVVVSPFLDQGFVKAFAGEGDDTVRRTLVSTDRAIRGVAPALGRYRVLSLDAPIYPEPDLPSSTDDQADADTQPPTGEMEEIGQGLHAKLLFMAAGARRTVWMGSANATLRAWRGRNVEIIAELTVTEDVLQGLRALIGSARKVDPDVLGELGSDVESDEKDPLDRAREQVAAQWDSTLSRDADDEWLLSHSGRPHPEQDNIALEVGLITGDLIPWPRGQLAVRLGRFSKDLWTELVQLRISAGEQSRAWIQRAPAEPALEVDRDHAALARLMGAQAFLRWVHGLLNDARAEPADTPWTAAAPKTRAQEPFSPLAPDLPTLEDILAAWARDPEAFAQIDRRVTSYLPEILNQVEAADPTGAAQLRVFDTLWNTLRAGLGRRR